MEKAITYIVIAVIAISSAAMLVHLNSTDNSKSVDYSQLNAEVRSSLMNLTTGSSTWAEYNGVHLNASAIVNHTMQRFYVLENLTSFKDYYLNYSENFSVSMVMSFNTSQFNNTDPNGLNLDYAYFVFNDIAKIKQPENVNVQQPMLLESIEYSINLGNGQISGPSILKNIATYN